MADYKKLIPSILKWEGGWSDDPADKGGATMRGITLATYTAYRFQKGLPTPTKTDLKNITQAEWEEVFKTMYWDRWKASEIKNQSIANLVVDWLWTSGVYGIKYPQQVLGTTADGVVGKKTLALINEHPNPKTLWKALWERRKKHFEAIANATPSNKKFLKGWLNRLNDFKYVD